MTEPLEDQLGLFDLEEGERLRDEGIALAEAADAGDREAIDAALSALAETGVSFSSDDVHAVIDGQLRPALVGARFRAAAGRGLIVHVGYTTSKRPSAHARTIRTWRGAR